MLLATSLTPLASLHPDYVRKHGLWYKGASLDPAVHDRPRRQPSDLANPASGSSCCEACSNAASDAAVACLVHCGFAVVPDIVDVAMLDAMRTAFEAWPDAKSSVPVTGVKLGETVYRQR